MFTYLEYVDPLKSQQKLKDKDLTKTPSGKDFNTFIMNEGRKKSPLSKKVFVQPVSTSERSGPKWYAEKQNC